MANDDIKLDIENAKVDFVAPSIYINNNWPGFRETGDEPATTMQAVYELEQREKNEQNRLDAIRIAQEQEARAQTAWQRDFSFGPVVKPVNNTLRAYKRLLRQSDSANDTDRDIRFNGRKYGIFDSVIVHEVGLDDQNNSLSPAFNPNHPRYKDYGPLRRNLAILRNYLMVNEFPDAVYKPGDVLPEHQEDKQNLLRLQDMATALGKELGGTLQRPRLLERWGQSATRMLTGGDMTQANTSAFMEAANIPDVGIATMYKFLLDKQGKATIMDAFLSKLTPSSWNLPPLEQSPFSNENMLLYSRSSAMSNIANAFQNITANVRSVDSLSVEDKAVSVEEARKILENLRIRMGQGREGERLDLTDTRRSECVTLLHAAIAFQDSMAALVKIDPNVLHNPDLIAAAQALEHANYQVTMDAARMLDKEGRHAEAQAMMARAQDTPEQYRTPMTLKEITERLDTGLDIAGELEKTYESKLSQMRAGRIPPSQQALQAQQAAARRKARAAVANPSNSNVAAANTAIRAAALSPTNKIKARPATPDTGTFSNRGAAVAEVSHPAVVEGATHINNLTNADAPYLTPTTRKR
jgi:hypothetical protein